MELRSLRSAGKTYFVIVDDDIQVGEVQFSELENAVFEINHTEIYASERGRGLDSQVVQKLIQYARENGLRLRLACGQLKSALRGKNGLDDVIVS